MKKILITGAGSYIGTSFASYLKQNHPNDYQVDTIDMIGDAWKNASFTGYDCVFHVAGLAHQKETKDNAHLYYEINRDLAIETAKKAKADGVTQFVFLSSMSVYGMETGIITKATVPTPKSHYGQSKLQAESGLENLACDTFRVCILRPPMVYGKDCKGNFQTVVRIVKKSPVFPRIKNERSMIYIDNLNSFVKLCVEKELHGVFFPQNKEYVQTTAMAKVIADSLNKKIYFSALLGLGVRLLRPFVSVAKKAFGTLIYKDLDEFDYSYCVSDNADSMERSVL